MYRILNELAKNLVKPKMRCTVASADGADRMIPNNETRIAIRQTISGKVCSKNVCRNMKWRILKSS
jgi:hypothetical protein